MGILAQCYKGHYLIVNETKVVIGLAWPQLTDLPPEGDSEDPFLWAPATVSQVLEGEFHCPEIKRGKLPLAVWPGPVLTS